MNRSQLVPDRVYKEENGLYFVSPDGVGCYWYDTLAELIEERGRPDKIHYVKTLTDW